MDAHLTLQGNDLTHAQGMAKYLWNNITPWLQADIGAVVRATGSDELKQSPFLALHISNSRGDKARLGEGGENDYTVRTALLANCDGDTPRGVSAMAALRGGSPTSLGNQCLLD